MKQQKYSLNSTTYGSYFVLCVDDEEYKIGELTCAELVDIIPRSQFEVSQALETRNYVTDETKTEIDCPRINGAESVTFRSWNGQDFGSLTLPTWVALGIVRIFRARMSP